MEVVEEGEGILFFKRTNLFLIYLISEEEWSMEMMVVVEVLEGRMVKMEEKLLWEFLVEL